MKIVIHKFKTLQDFEVAVPAEILGGNGNRKNNDLGRLFPFVLTGKAPNGSEFKTIYDNQSRPARCDSRCFLL